MAGPWIEPAGPMSSRVEKSPAGAYEEVWKVHERRQRQWIHVSVFGFGAACLIGYSLDWILKSHMPFIVLGASWFIAALFTGAKVQRLKCPRCGELFFFGTTYKNEFASRCLNCGLPKWSCDPDAGGGTAHRRRSQ